MKNKKIVPDNDNYFTTGRSNGNGYFSEDVYEYMNELDEEDLKLLDDLADEHNNSNLD
jgi:hypothetical protein